MWAPIQLRLCNTGHDRRELLFGNRDRLGDSGVAIDTRSEGYVRLPSPHDESLTNPGSEVTQGGAALRMTLENPRESATRRRN